MDENISWNPLVNWSESKSISHSDLTFKKTSKPATEANTVQTRWNRKIDAMSKMETDFWSHFQPIAPLMQEVNNPNLQNEDSAPPYISYKTMQINWTDSFQAPNSGSEDNRNLPPKVIECEGKVFEYSQVVADMTGTMKAGIIHLEGDVQIVKCFFSSLDLWGCCPEEVCVGTMVGVNARLLPSHERIQGIDYMAASVWRLGMRIPPILTARLIEAVDHKDLERYKALAPQLDLRNLVARQKVRKTYKEDEWQGRSYNEDRGQGRSYKEDKCQGRSYKDEWQGRSYKEDMYQGRSYKEDMYQGRSYKEDKCHGRSRKIDEDHGRISSSRGRKRSRSRSRGRSRSRSNGRSRSRSNGRSWNRSRGRSRSRSYEISRNHSRGRSRNHSYGRTRSRSRERSRNHSRERVKRFRSKSGESGSSSTGKSHGGYTRDKDRKRSRKRSTSSNCRKHSRSRSKTKRRAPMKRDSRSSSIEFVRSAKSFRENYQCKLPIPPPVPAKPRVERGFQFAPVLRESWKLQLPAPVPSQLGYPPVQKKTANCSLDEVLFRKNQGETQVSKVTTKPQSKHFDWFHNGKEWVYATEQPPLVEGFKTLGKKAKCRVCSSNYDCSDNTFAYNVHTTGVIHRIAAAGVQHLAFETPLFSVLARGSVMCNACGLELETANVVEGHLETSFHAQNMKSFVKTNSASGQELQVVYGSQAIYGAPVRNVSDGDNAPENRQFTAFGKWPKVKKSSKKSKDLDGDNVPENKEFTAFGKWPKIKKSSKKSTKDLDGDNVPENKEFAAFGNWPKIKKSSKKSTKDLTEREEHKSSKKKKKKVEKMARKIVGKLVNKAVEKSILKTVNRRRKMICQTNDEAVKSGTNKNIHFRPMFESSQSVILKLKLSESMICNLCDVSVTWTEPHNIVKRNLAVKKHKLSHEHSVHVNNAKSRTDDDEEALVYSDELEEWLKDTLPKTEDILTVCLETLDDDSVICLACPMCPPMVKNVAENVHIQTAKHIKNMQIFYANDEIEKMGWYPSMAEDYFKLEVGQDSDTDVEFVCVKEKQRNCNLESWDVARYVLSEVLHNIDNDGREKEETNGVGVYNEDSEVCSSFDTSNTIAATELNETSALLDLIQRKRETLEMIDALFEDLISDIVAFEDCRLPAKAVEDTSEWGQWIEKCFYCAKRHVGVNVCAAKVKTCKFCKKVGHLEKIHLEQDSVAREDILEALNNNDTGDVFSGVGLWTDYRPLKPMWKVDPRKSNLLVLEI